MSETFGVQKKEKLLIKIILFITKLLGQTNVGSDKILKQKESGVQKKLIYNFIRLKLK